jgi:DMSO reductase anchor subunit
MDTQATDPLFVLPGGIAVDATLIVGVAATLAAFALFVCTAMLYAGVKFLQEWHSPLTVFNYILLGGASGFTLAAAFVGADLVGFYGIWAVLLTLAALVSRGASLLRNRRLRPKSTPQTAIGVRHPVIRQKAQGAMGGSFNTREFFHGRAPRTLRWVKFLFLILVFPLPIAILGAAYGPSSPTLPMSASPRNNPTLRGRSPPIKRSGRGCKPRPAQVIDLSESPVQGSAPT